MIGLCGHPTERADESCARCVAPHPRHGLIRVEPLPNWPGPLLAHVKPAYCSLCGQSEGHWRGCAA